MAVRFNLVSIQAEKSVENGEASDTELRRENIAAESVNGRVGQQFSSLAISKKLSPACSISKKLPAAMLAGRVCAGFLLGPAPMNDVASNSAGIAPSKPAIPQELRQASRQFRRNCAKQAGNSAGIAPGKPAIPQELRLAMPGSHEYSPCVRFRPDSWRKRQRLKVNAAESLSISTRTP